MEHYGLVQEHEEETFHLLGVLLLRASSDAHPHHKVRNRYLNEPPLEHAQHDKDHGTQGNPKGAKSGMAAAPGRNKKELVSKDKLHA